MPAGTSRTATGVTVTVARDPALVRTVRLVAAAVARRAGRDEEFVEEVRLAAGEACALLVGETPDSSEVAEPVTVSITIDDHFRVEVVAQDEVSIQDPPHADIDGVEPWALLRGLVENFEVTQQDGATTVSMSWPLV
jgi:anti-sigma regulatory factor (Ser/Thr protein kinase)